MLEEGWYLMSLEELEQALSSLRRDAPDRSVGVKLTTEDALAFRDAGNLPDEWGRTLRLVLKVEEGAMGLDRRRLLFEPDYHEAPSWKRDGSKPINIVPLGWDRPRDTGQAWWEEPGVAELEEEWQRAGTVRGVKVPADYRSFVHKTVLSLEAAGRKVTAASIADSIERWVRPSDAERIRAALMRANQ